MFGIQGLLYIPQYISPATHDQFVTAIDQEIWRTDLARRTQHYGYVYDYRAKRVDPSMHLGALPKWLQPTAIELQQDGLISQIPDQAIINEYEPGQGIADHIDCIPCFGGVIVSLSLASTSVMLLKNGSEVVPILLEPRSLLILQGPARYQWTHGIPRRKRDVVNDLTLKRQRRLSITFRKIVID